MVEIPRVVVDRGAAFTDVQLLLSPDGTYSILSATAEVIIDPGVNTYPLRTAIVNFDRISSGTVFELEDGQLWRVDTDYFGSHFESTSELSVIIFETSSGFQMSIEDDSSVLDIHPFEYNDKIDSSIPSWGGLSSSSGTIFELANGEFWKVTDSIFGSIFEGDADDGVTVTIYDTGSEHIIMVDGRYEDLSVEPL